MNRQANNLVERLQALGPEQVADVEDFIEFLRHRSEQRQLAQAAAGASTPAFEAIWNNSEDEVYDAL
jgi:hypothetical protein